MKSSAFAFRLSVRVCVRITSLSPATNALEMMKKGNKLAAYHRMQKWEKVEKRFITKFGFSDSNQSLFVTRAHSFHASFLRARLNVKHTQ